MRKTLILLTSVGLLGLGAGRAETLDATAAPSAAMPVRGMSMAAVQRQYGEPTLRHAPAGGERAEHPPITRWDYPGFSVFFERGTVIDTVQPDAPARVHRRAELIDN